MLSKLGIRNLFIILLFCFLLVFIHSVAQFIPDEYCTEVRNVQRIVLASIGIFGGALLFIKSDGVRSRKFFAFLMFMVAMAVIANGLIMWLNDRPYLVPKRSMSIGIMVYGGIYGYLFLLYPIEVVRPGWLTKKRALMLLIPLACAIVIYKIYTTLTGGRYLPIEEMTLMDRLKGIDMWLRLLIFLYPVGCLAMMMKYRKEYKNWIEENYSEMRDINIDWLSYYIAGYGLILVSYIYMFTVDGIQVVLAHGIFFVLFFILLYGKILFHENPYPEGHFKSKETQDNEEYISYQTQLEESGSTDNFAEKIPEYKQIVEDWMRTEKPYLRKDFKLIDLNEKIPLNRSYLSRLLNEGFNDKFYNVVMKYRIEESIRLLDTEPNLSLQKIAEQSGFSSQSVFGRAFNKYFGMSPSAYREAKEENKEKESVE